jgi:hypothetical protein
LSILLDPGKRVPPPPWRVRTPRARGRLACQARSDASSTDPACTVRMKATYQKPDRIETRTRFKQSATLKPSVEKLTRDLQHLAEPTKRPDVSIPDNKGVSAGINLTGMPCEIRPRLMALTCPG